MIYELINGNGKVKEYASKLRLEYEGEYLNGKKNGKGKEYNWINYNYLLYEGEYLNGHKNGKGKEYLHISGKLKYEGEFLNDKYNGKGKEYYVNGIICFEGEYLNGSKWNGTLYDKEHKHIFKLKNGKGYIKAYDIFAGILIFEGQYINGVRNGKGKEYYFMSELKF